MPTPGDIFWGGPRVPERKRVLTARLTGSLPNNGDDQLGSVLPGEDPVDGYIRERKAGVTFSAPGASPFFPAVMQATPGTARALGFLLEVQDGFGGSNSYDGRNDFVRPLHVAGNNDSTFEAVWTCTDVQTRFYVYFLNTGVAGANGDPTYGGPAVGDVNPRALGIIFYEVAKAGATVTATMSVEGPEASGSVSCSTVLTEDTPILSYYASADLLLQVGNNLGSISATATALFHDDWEYIGPASPLSDASGPMSATVSGGSLSVSVVGDFDTGGGDTVFTGGVALRGEPDRRYKVQGHLYAMDKDYPGSLNLGILGSPVGQPQSVTLAPDGSADVVQRTYLAESIWDDFSRHTLGSVAEWDAIKTYLTSASLTAAGEDTNDWVTMTSDRSYPALNLAHAEETALPDPTEDDGVWSHTFSGSPGNWEGYRYLKVTLKTDEVGETVTLSTDSDPGKTFEITTTSTSLTDYFVDLCRPKSPEPSSNPDLKDSRYTIRNDGLSHYDRPNWGIGRVRSYSLAGGTNLDVDAVVLARRGDVEHDACVAFNDFELIQDSESYHADGSMGAVPIIQGSRGVVITVDGRRSIIEPCTLRQLMSDGGGSPLWVYSGRNARDFEATANACPGFTCDESPYTPGDGWMALDGSEGANLIDGGPIYYAGWSGFQNGGGVLWNGETPTNVLGQAIADEPTTILYQPRYHEIITFPACGDVWGDSGGGYSDPMPIRVAKILRAAVDGIVYGPEGEEVELLDETATEVSNAFTDPLLIYRMGPTPLGKGQRDHTARWSDGTNTFNGEFVGEWDPEQGLGAEDAAQNRWNARRLHRAVFRIILRLRRGVHLSTELNTGIFLLVRAHEGEVTTRTFDTPAGIDLSATVGEGDSAQGVIYPDGTFAVFYDREGVIYTRESYNQGETWGEEMAITSGTHPAPEAETLTGIKYLAKWEADDWRLWRQLPEDTWADAGLIVSAPEGCAGLRQDPTQQGALIFAYDDGSGPALKASYNHGDTWEDL